MNTKYEDVWVVSDPHFGHKNLVYGESEWANRKKKCRPFATLNDHDETLIYQINKHVKPNDLFICLGDWSFGDQTNISYFRYRINCENVFLITGNHDRYIKSNKKVKCYNSDKKIRAQDIFTYVSDEFLFQHDGAIYYCNHFMKTKKYRDLNRLYTNMYPDKKVFHLFGHTHGLFNSDGMLDIGYENAYHLFGQWRPFNIDEVKRLLLEKKLHHESNS